MPRNEWQTRQLLGRTGTVTMAYLSHPRMYDVSNARRSRLVPMLRRLLRAEPRQSRLVRDVPLAPGQKGTHGGQEIVRVVLKNHVARPGDLHRAGLWLGR